MGLRTASFCAVLAIGACKGPSDDGERTPAARTETASAGNAPAAEIPDITPQVAKKLSAAAKQAQGSEGADGKQCQDWSTLDVKSLPPLPQTPYSKTFDQVWELVRTKHFDKTLGCTNWPEIRTKYGAALADAKDISGAYKIIGDMLHELEQSHFGIIPPEDRISEGDGGPARPKLRARFIEGQVVVVESHEGAIAPGAVIDAIDGKSIADIVDKAKSTADRPAEQAFKIARGVQGRLACQPGGSHELTVRDSAGKSKTARVSCSLPEGEPVTLGNLKNIPTIVEHRMIESGGVKVGYVHFNIWMLPLVAKVRAAMGELTGQGMQALVLDLRGNPGGVGPMSVPVGRMLLKDGGTLGKLQFRDFANEFNVAANPGAFNGPVAVLVDEGTASTSEIFAAGMRDLGRITVIGGGPSAGAALPSLIEELEGGAIFQYVVGDYHSPKGTVVEGKGVVPDVVVRETRADFAADKDPVLDAAVQHLTKG